jgi:PAS domain S-box-containing protein
MPSPEQILIGHYDYRLVALSVLISILSSYVVLDLAGRTNTARGWARRSWLLGGGAAMGICIWSMHYTAMPSFHLPVPVLYDWPTILLALLPALVTSIISLEVVNRQRMRSLEGVAAAMIMAGGIVGLHYTAMTSMRLPAERHYSPALVTVSIVFAIVFSLLSLWLMFLFRDVVSGKKLQKASGAVLMGAAISAMHYTGMAAASYLPSDAVPGLSHALNISALDIDSLGLVTLILLQIAVLASRLQKQTTLLDELFEEAPQAVALMNGDHSVVRVNKEFTRMFGYSQAEAIGRRLRDLIVPEEAREETRKYAEMARQGRRVDAEGIRLRKDGSSLNVSVVHLPVSLPGGQLAVYEIDRDITESKRAKAKIQATTEQLRALSARLESAREEEGTRIARELHDELGSTLTALKCDIEVFARALSDGESLPQRSSLQEKIEGMTRLTDSTINAVRRISSELRPVVLDDLGLIAAISWQARQFEKRTGIICVWRCPLENLDLTAAQSTGLYRVLQEALTNVLRHSQATRVETTIGQETGEIVLTISDNGRGITEDQTLSQLSLGLLGMQERVHVIGGEIDIAGIEGKGTTITVRVPLSDERL